MCSRAIPVLVLNDHLWQSVLRLWGIRDWTWAFHNLVKCSTAKSYPWPDIASYVVLHLVISCGWPEIHFCYLIFPLGWSIVLAFFGGSKSRDAQVFWPCAHSWQCSGDCMSAGNQVWASCMLVLWLLNEHLKLSHWNDRFIFRTL